MQDAGGRRVEAMDQGKTSNMDLFPGKWGEWKGLVRVY